jgi:hypothetical protein
MGIYFCQRTKRITLKETFMTENQKQEITGLFTGKDVANFFKGVVFLFDQIPEKKLQNAIKNYAPIKNGEKVILLYEYSAKEGVLLTTTHLYVNQPTYSGCSVGASAAVSDISSFSHRKKGLMSPEEYIDINVGLKTLTIQYMYGKQLMSALEKTISILKSGGLAGISGATSQPAVQEATASSNKLKDEYEQGQKQGEEFADKLFDAADKAKNALGKLGGLFGKK